MNKHKINRIDVLSAGKLGAAFVFFMVLLYLIPMSIYFAVVSVVIGMQDSGPEIPTIGIGLGIAAFILVPFILAILGFVSNAISAMIYNLFTHFIGGIEVELEPVFSKRELIERSGGLDPMDRLDDL